MLKQEHVAVDLVKGSKDEYIIRDTIGITVGRVFITELSHQNRYCNFKINFYKSGQSSYELLKESLKVFLMSLFKNMNIYKVNVVADEEINIRAFTDLGFRLEGIVSNSVIYNNSYKNQLLFGVDFDVFKNEHRHKDMQIKGTNIDVVVLTPNDAEEVLAYYIKNREYLRPFEPDRDESFYTLYVQRRNLIESYKQFLNGDSVNFGIYKNKNLIGKLQISNIVMGVFKNAFVGYSIDENEQGKGYMKEALSIVSKYAFDEIGLHRLEGSTLLNNEKSQRVLKSCGFKELGINKQYLFINGEWKDHITFYKIK